MKATGLPRQQDSMSRAVKRCHCHGSQVCLTLHGWQPPLSKPRSTCACPLAPVRPCPPLPLFLASSVRIYASSGWRPDTLHKFVPPQKHTRSPAARFSRSNPVPPCTCRKSFCQPLLWLAPYREMFGNEAASSSAGPSAPSLTNLSLPALLEAAFNQQLGALAPPPPPSAADSVIGGFNAAAVVQVELIRG